MNNIFLTGMGRSGTTLLEKLLENHSKISLLEQPFPLLFTEIKKEFLKTLNIDEYFVLNNTPYDKKYKLEEFINFLNTYKITKEKIFEIFQKMNTYSGQIEKNKKIIFNFNNSEQFIDVYNSLLQTINPVSNIMYIGSKEIFCEEFLPYFLQHNKKTIIILRDPKDILASANYPQGKKYLGEKKPSLFLLQAWRKSVEFCYLLKSNKNFYFLKYEDLVENPYFELNKLTNFLSIEPFQNNHFENGIYTKDGKLWSSNTSFDTHKNSFISKGSVGIYKKVLSIEEINYVDTICQHELKWLNYTYSRNNNPLNIIENFVDINISEHDHLSSNFSSLSQNIKLEKERYKNYKTFYV